MDAKDRNSEGADDNKGKRNEPQPSTSSEDGGKRKSPCEGENLEDRERKNARRSEESSEQQTTEEVVASGSGSGEPEPSASEARIIDDVENIVERIDLRRVLKNLHKRRYRRNRQASTSSDSDDEAPPASDRNSASAGFLGMDVRDVAGIELASSPSSSSDSDGGHIDGDPAKLRAKIEATPTPEVLLKPKPKHNWFATPEILGRQVGYCSRRQGSKLFEERMYGSLHAVQRLELMYKLENHAGCVNSINFNASGSMLASCSDDLTVCIWNWPVGKHLSSIQSGHKSNVFQAKFLPLQGHLFLATCARDGQVLILELQSDGSLFARRKAGQHHRPCHKLSLVKDSPHVFLSCGEDSLVLSIDIRQNRANKVISVTGDGKKVPLYSVSCHPLDSNEFMVGGRDRYLRIYDRRNISSPVRMICPNHLRAGNGRYHAYVTSAVYNYNGSELLASYNDEDIYLWDRRETLPDFAHKYQGHRNNATIKGVNFFGPKSEYIVSGSDCGNIFFWDKETESIVQFMAGDEHGVVNCLEPHPSIPVLATSGLDEDVKIWVPSNEQDPTFEGLRTAVIINQKDRDEDRSGGRNSDADSQMLWLLWRHISRAGRRVETAPRDPSNLEEDEEEHGSNYGEPQLGSSSDDEQPDAANTPFTYSDCSPS